MTSCPCRRIMPSNNISDLSIPLSRQTKALPWPCHITVQTSSMCLQTSQSSWLTNYVCCMSWPQTHAIKEDEPTRQLAPLSNHRCSCLDGARHALCKLHATLVTAKLEPYTISVCCLSGMMPMWLLPVSQSAAYSCCMVGCIVAATAYTDGANVLQQQLHLRQPNCTCHRQQPSP